MNARRFVTDDIAVSGYGTNQPQCESEHEDSGCPKHKKDLPNAGIDVDPRECSYHE